MQRAGAWRLCQTIVLTSGVALASAMADAAVPSKDTTPAAVVLRGTAVSPAEAPPVSDSDPPTVLRGSPPSAPQSHAIPSACPAGLDYDANYGCLSPGYAYAPDYGYWPYFGFGQTDNFRRRGFRHAFGHDKGRGSGFRLGLPGFGGVAHAGGVAHVGGGFAHAGGFGHR